MKVVSYLFIIIIISACSVFNKRSPSSVSNIFNYEQNGLNFVELDVELSSLKPRITIPRFTINSIDHDQQDPELRLIHENTIVCIYLSESENIAECSLVRGNKGKLRIIYSFTQFESFPIYEVDWASHEIKKHFNKNDITKSKIFRKISGERDLNSLFLNEKISLLEILGKEQSVKLVFPKRKILKLDEKVLDVILITKITSSIMHESIGEVPISGIESKKFPDYKFEKRNLNAYEFYCESKLESHLVEDEVIIIEDHGSKVRCQFNDRVRGLFGKLYTKGSLSFNIVSVDLEEAVKELEVSEIKNTQKLKKIIDSINDNNVNSILNGLQKIRSIYGL